MAPILEESFDYLARNFNETDGHIAAEQTHDWWSQYQGANIDPSQIKYEAEVDMMSASALDNASSLFAALAIYIRPAPCICRFLDQPLGSEWRLRQIISYRVRESC